MFLPHTACVISETGSSGQAILEIKGVVVQDRLYQAVRVVWNWVCIFEPSIDFINWTSVLTEV